MRRVVDHSRNLPRKSTLCPYLFDNKLNEHSVTVVTSRRQPSWDECHDDQVWVFKVELASLRSAKAFYQDQTHQVIARRLGQRVSPASDIHRLGRELAHHAREDDVLGAFLKQRAYSLKQYQRSNHLTVSFQSPCLNIRWCSASAA